MILERERKFLLKGLPDETTEAYDKAWYITQCYDRDNVRFRMARDLSGLTEDEYTHTKKTPTEDPMVREEIEINISKEEFVAAYKKPGTKYIYKTRFMFDYGAYILVIDWYKDDHELVIAEVETKNKQAILPVPDFIKPMLIMEVTGMPEFLNENLAIEC